ncbi:hypothetical protein DV738_g5424, partial [Chaetothyriales sp. CBS 135597]
MEVDFGGLVASPSGSASAPAAAPAVVDFQPFFALVEDTVTREHFHPTVHYIFADDESDIITEAVCRSLEQPRTTEREQESVEDLIARFQRGLDDIRTVMLTGQGPEPVGEDES